jgi:hypothetical protein
MRVRILLSLSYNAFKQIKLLLVIAGCYIVHQAQVAVDKAKFLARQVCFCGHE